MEKQIKKLVILFCAILLCLTYLVVFNGRDKKEVINSETGIVFHEKIYCKPSNNVTQEFYKENKISLIDVPNCENMKIWGIETSINGNQNTKDLFGNILVRPLSFLLIQIGKIFNNYLIAFFILIFIKSIFIFFNNLKMRKNSLKINSIKDEISSLSNKYAKESPFWNDENIYNESLARINYADDLKKVYKEHNIHPMGGCLIALIQLPILLAFINILYTIPIISESSIFGLNLGVTIKYLLNNGSYFILLLPLLLAITTYLSVVITIEPNTDIKKNRIMGIILTIFIIIASFSFPLGLSVYFILGDILNVFGKLIVKKICK